MLSIPQCEQFTLTMTKDRNNPAGAGASSASNSASASVGSGVGENSGGAPSNPGGSQDGAGAASAVAPEQIAPMAPPEKMVFVPMPKVPCTIDLNAVDLPKQMANFNDAFRDALLMANLICDDGTFAISNQRIMAMWRSNLTQEVKDAIKEIKYEYEFQREDFLVVSEKLIQMRKLKGLARMNDFNLSMVIRGPNEPLEQFKKRLVA
jgi:hypothetical protein